MSIKKRNLIIGIGLLGVIVVLALFLNFKNNLDDKEEIKTPVLKKSQVERNLTDSERGIYESRLSQAQQNLKQLESKRGVVDSREYFTAYINIGFQYYGLGKLSDAVYSYTKALQYQENDYRAYSALYLVYLESEDFDKSRQAIQKVVELKPQDPDGWRKYLVLEEGKFYVDFKRQDELYNQALEKTVRNLDILSLYADFLQRNSKFTEALKILQEIQKAKPGTNIDQAIQKLRSQIGK